MDGWFSFFSEKAILRNSFATIILLIFILLFRWVALNLMQRAHWESEQNRMRWNFHVRGISLTLVTLGLIVVWASELRSLAISLAAIAVAIVVATKELILCFSGSIVRTASSAYSVGNRVEIDGTRGDVVDIGLFTTTILETGPGHKRTGRSIILPNSILLSKPVINESFTDDFVLHIIYLPVASKDWEGAEKRLLVIANDVCGSFLNEARDSVHHAAQKSGVPEIGVEPTVNIQVVDDEKFKLVLRVPSRAREKGLIEQEIIRRFFADGSEN